MKEDKFEAKYLEYLGVYTNVILEFWTDLQKQVKKKMSGDVSIKKKKFRYFLINNWITLINAKNNLELSFHFNKDWEDIYFEKSKFHNYIESDLNASWLTKEFPSNKTLREEKFNICFENLINSERIIKSEKWYLITKDEAEFL